MRVVAGDARGRGQTLVYQGAAVLLVAFVSWLLISDVLGRPRARAGAPDGELMAAQDPTKPSTGGAPVARDPSSVNGAATMVAGSSSPRHMEPRRKAIQRPGVVPPEELTDKLPPGVDPSKVTAKEYIEYLHAAGIDEGIGAFPPPGTKPPLEGNAVPPDFELPEGYVRHNQVTDDGQDIETILMYSPDYEFFDENGNLIPIPEDRVVPADRIPKGMPVRPVQIPEPLEGSGLGR